MVTNRIQAFIRAAAAHGRDTERIGPFLATFSRSDTNPFLNYAVPDDGAQPFAGDVQRLIEAYQRRGRRPRLEYITALAPEVEPVLLAAGFTVEGRLALMTCRPGEARQFPAPGEIELLRPETPDELLALRSVQHEAYGELRPATPADADQVAEHLRAGGMAVLARVRDSGEAAGAGQYTVPIDGMCEISSIAVREPFRRRGVAAAITSSLLQKAFESGITDPFLMANAPEERIYARVGFRTISDILHISLPAEGG